MTKDNPPVSASISTEKLAALNAAIEEVGADREKFCHHLGIADLGDLREADHPRALQLLEAKRADNARKARPRPRPARPKTTWRRAER